MFYTRSKLLLYYLLIVLGLFKASTNHAQQIAFPGAEGAGMFTTGGRGTPSVPSTVFEVTNLSDDGQPGSLRYALSATATYRTVVFRVSGTIHLNSKLNIRANTTLAGQTAPGEGICVADQPVVISGDNVIVRYMRFRMGDKNQNKGMVDGSGGDDAFGALGANNLMIDHCSVSWSSDEALTIYRGDNLTIQWCMVSEPLNYSYHFETGDTDYEQHGYGGIWGAKRGTMHHNLIAHCRNRNPRFAGIGTYSPNTVGVENVDFRNNVLYNWGINTVYGGDGGNYNVVNNYYKYGPNTSSGVRYRICNPSYGTTTPYGKWYVAGNYVDGSPAYTADNWAGGVVPQGGTADLSTVRALTAFELGYPINTQPATEAYESVLNGAGCSLPNRDTLDQRIVSNVLNRTGRIIDVQGGYPHGTPYEQTVSAWPTLNSLAAPLDSDHDGMPDSWETANGLNPNSADDRGIVAANGFTNLENYLNSLTNPVVTTNPVIYANPSFNNFAQTIGVPSASQTFQVSGANLTGDITLSASANYQLSSDGTNWNSSINLAANSGSVSSTTVSVRLNAPTAGTYSGNIVVSGGGASSISIALNGTAAAPAPEVQSKSIGYFPDVDGGFENQTLGSYSTVSTHTSTTKWEASSGFQILGSGARTGSKVMHWNGASSSVKYLLSPVLTAPTLQAGTSYVVQFWYKKAASAGTGSLSLSGYNSIVGGMSGSAGTTTTQKDVILHSTALNDWVLFKGVMTTQSSVTVTNTFGGIKVENPQSPYFDVDDYVIYPGSTFDETAPEAVASPSAIKNPGANTVAVSWHAPASGVDGGGYVIVRSTSATIPVPNAKGVYIAGNIMGTNNVVVYTGQATNFTDDGSIAALTAGTTYYYYIFTADKAFNYSQAVTAQTTVSVTVPTVSLSGDLSSFSQTVGTPSTSKQFTVTGSNLSDNVNVTAPAGFELSDDDNTWSTSLSFTPNSNSINENAFVRLNATVAGSYSGNIEVASAGATSANLTVSGTASAIVVIPPPAGYDVVVALDGSGQYTSLQAAINAAPSGRTTPYRIFIKKGKYWEKIVIPSTKPFLQLIGEDVANTKIIYGDGLGGTTTVTIQANDVMLMNLTLENAQGYVSDGPQSLAVKTDADRIVFKNCRFISGQDTVMVNGNGKRVYFKTCYIDGNTDFIYGAAVAAFDSCVVYPRDRVDGSAGGYVTAANTPDGQTYGLVFRDCMIPNNRGITSYTLGRPWQNSTRETSTGTNAHNSTVFLNTIMSSSITPAGWSVWDAGTNTNDITYAEYKSKKFDGSMVNVSQRVSWSKQLTETQATVYYVNSNLYGTWDPYAIWSDLAGNTAKPIAIANFRGIRNSTGTTLPFNISWPIANVKYELHRSTDSMNYSKIKELIVANDTTVAYAFTDALPPAGVNYYYKIVANKEGYETQSTDTVVTINLNIPINGDFRTKASGGWTNNVTAIASIANGVVNGVTITSSPAGYTSAPTVTFATAPTGGTTATGTAVLTDGAVTGVTITNPGSGYTSAPSVSFSSTGVGGNSIWEKYNASIKAWETVALGTAPSNTNVIIASGHTVAVNALVGITGLTIQNGGVLQTDGQSRNFRIKGDVNNNGVFGGINTAVNKLTLELDGTNGTYNINGEGLYNFITLRSLTGIQTLTVNLNANLTLSGNLQGWYGSTSATDLGDDNVTINIGKGYTVKAGVLHSSSTTNTAATFGNYTYNVDGVLDLSGSTTLSGLIPHATASTKTITLNINGVLKTGTQFRTVSTTPGASEGKVVLTIGDGGLIDATKTNTTFAVTPNYFVATGNGALKRSVGSTAVTFPIGTSSNSYNPVVLTNTGTADNFTVGVQNTFDNPVADAAKVVNKQWNITEDVEGGSNVTAKFGWNAADQASAFDPSQLLAVMKYSAGIWNITASNIGGSGTIADPYTATVSGITSFSPFGVTNYTKATATIKMEEGSFRYDGQSHAATGFAYGSGGEGDRLNPEVSITYKDDKGQVLPGAPFNAGTYSVTASFAGNSYYQSASATTSITIHLRPLTITATDQIMECGSEMALGTTAFIADGLVANDAVRGVNLNSTGGSVGTYLLVPSNAEGAGLFNYSITYVTGSLDVKDATKPVITSTPVVPTQCYNFSGRYAIPQLTAIDQCGSVHISYTITGVTVRSGNGADASGNFNVGTSIINWVVDDGHGNQVTSQTHVVVNEPLVANIPDVYAMNPAKDEKNTIYVGYGPTLLSINAVAGGGSLPYTYQWGDGQASQSISVTAAGTYSVTVKDAFQCVAFASIVINSLDVSCGKDNSKVKVCHNGKEICITSEDVQDHLGHGDRLGGCNAVAYLAPSSMDLEGMAANQVRIYPNPVTENININVNNLQAGAMLQLYNTNGTMLLSQRLTRSTEMISVKGLPAGIYYVVVRNGREVRNHKIVKQ